MPPPYFFRGGVLLSNGRNWIELFDLNQFRPKLQQLCLARQSAGMFRVKRNSLEIVSDPQPHKVIPHELLAGQTIPVVFAELPGPGQGLVRDALV